MDITAMLIDVVDDDANFAQSAAWVLQSFGYATRTFSTGYHFLCELSITVPNVVIIDLLLPGMTGLHLCHEIVARQVPCAFVVVSGHADVRSVVEVMQLGAIDLLEKPFTRQRLLEVAGDAAQAACKRQRLLQEEMQTVKLLQELSTREREVFDAVAAGLVTKEIAKHFGISARTVDVHRSRIMRKLGMSSPLQFGSILAVVERMSQQNATHHRLTASTGSWRLEAAPLPAVCLSAEDVELVDHQVGANPDGARAAVSCQGR